MGARGTVEYGEGQAVTRGPAGAGPVVPPNDIIRKPFETRTIDGVKFEFQLALDTEAPSEMFVYLPGAHVLDVGEDATHTLHNLLPIRGTLVRNGLTWSQALNTALDHFGGDVQILINQHQWPVWGNARVRTALANHRDLYKYIHDQTLRMMNEGMTPAEIAASADHAARAGEGLVAARLLRHACPRTRTAVYQRYAGWYDGNPANLDPLAAGRGSAKKAVEYMGGADAVIARAREDFKAGNYRWVAQVMDQVVFADPSNKAGARPCGGCLRADGLSGRGRALAQFLSAGGAAIARAAARGAPARPRPPSRPEVLHVMPAGEMFDYLGTRIDGPRAGAAKIVINWRFTDTHETLVSTLAHGALTWSAGKADPNADASVTTTPARDRARHPGTEDAWRCRGSRRIAVTGNAKALSGSVGAAGRLQDRHSPGRAAIDLCETALKGCAGPFSSGRHSQFSISSW